MITDKILTFIAAEEAIVREAYLDAVGVWTWGVGVTAATGVDVLAYKDRPVCVQTCLAAFRTQLSARYLPEVLQAFEGFQWTEHQLGAALSFHYNTGAIGRAGWVQAALEGSEDAEARFMEWRKPSSIRPRRRAECALFFRGLWPENTAIKVFGVKKPSYCPDYASYRTVLLL